MNHVAARRATASRHQASDRYFLKRTQVGLGLVVVIETRTANVRIVCRYRLGNSGYQGKPDYKKRNDL